MKETTIYCCLLGVFIALEFVERRLGMAHRQSFCAPLFLDVNAGRVCGRGSAVCSVCSSSAAQIWSAANFAVLIYILSGVRIPSQDEDGYILIIWAPGADSYENTRVMRLYICSGHIQICSRKQTAPRLALPIIRPPASCLNVTLKH